MQHDARLLDRPGGIAAGTVRENPLGVRIARAEANDVGDVLRVRDGVALGDVHHDDQAALVRHRGRVVSREELLREVWGYAAGSGSRTVETHLAALRSRLGDDPQAPRYIVTVRRAGYRLEG